MATDFQSLFRRTPFTTGLVFAFVGCALAGLFAPRAIAQLALADPGMRPWSLLTYPFAIDPLGSPMGIISMIFLVMLLLQFGKTVEGEMGTLRYAGFWAAFTLLPALIACVLELSLAGPWLPSAALIVAWCARNRSARIMLYGILPISGVWLAGLVAAGVLLGYGSAGHGLGLAMLLPVGLAWVFASDKTPLAYSAARASKRKLTTVRGGQSYDERYFENVKQRKIDREDRERLRKLFEED